MLKIFIGYDPRQAISYNVCQHSILIRVTKPVAIIPLVIEALPIKRQGLTPFTWSRFLVPYLSDFKGISIFLDADIILQSDINELIELINNIYADKEMPAVSVVKSSQKFEWASVIVFNCSHKDNLILTPNYIDNTKENLHQISWTENIGEIPGLWNHLVGYDKEWNFELYKSDVKLIHYTQGVPAWLETSDCEFSEEWKKELNYMNSSIGWVDLMGKSVHATKLTDGSIVPKYKINNLKQAMKKIEIKNKTYSNQYLEAQTELHKNDNYGVASLSFAPIVAEFMRNLNIKSVADYGAGKKRLFSGLEKEGVKNFEYYPYDPVFPEYGPPVSADLVCCIDVLEHIEPEYLDNVLSELHSIIYNIGFFTIHMGPAGKVLSDGRNAHLIQQPTSWWLPILCKYFNIMHLASHNMHGKGFWLLVESIKK